MSAVLKTTSEAEGLPRRRFTIQEVEWMTHVGILDESERFELIGGELVPMNAKGSFHERMKAALMLYWARRLPPGLLFITETTFRFTPDTFLEPDFVFYPEISGWNGLSAETARLVVEVADSSLSYDRGLKASLYARFGIRELWVIDAVRQTSRVYRRPAPAGYLDIRDHGPDVRLVPDEAPELAVVLSELKLH